MERVADIKRRAQNLLKDGHWEEAIKAYEKLAETSEPDPYLYVLIGDVHLRRKAMPEAMQGYQKAIDGYRETGLLKNAIGLCKKLLRLNHQKAMVLSTLAELNAQDGLAGEAAVCYLAAAQEDLAHGHREGAVDRLQSAVGVAPIHAEASRRLVELLESLGHPNRAAGELMRMAAALRMAGRGTDADVFIKQAKQLDPTAEVPELDLSAPAAAASVSEAPEIQAHPTLEGRRESAGMHGLESTSLGADKQARLEPVPVPEDPGTNGSHGPTPPPMRSVVVKDEAPEGDELMNLSDILQEFRESLETQISPDDARSHYDMAMAYMEMNLLGDAVAELAAASREPELRPKCCEMLGQCYLRQNLPADAERILNRGLESPGLTAESTLSLRYHLALALEDLDRHAESQEQLEQVVKVRADFMDAAIRLEALRLRRAS